MSKKEPTDRQLVMWWMYKATGGHHGLYPTWVSVQYVVDSTFGIGVRKERAKRLADSIRNEVARLRVIYEKKARVLL